MCKIFFKKALSIWLYFYNRWHSNHQIIDDSLVYFRSFVRWRLWACLNDNPAWTTSRLINMPFSTYYSGCESLQPSNCGMIMITTITVWPQFNTTGMIFFAGLIQKSINTWFARGHQFVLITPPSLLRQLFFYNVNFNFISSNHHLLSDKKLSCNIAPTLVYHQSIAIP